jgi:two-component system, chemotaxis family, chemotaxis protein CheY
MRTLIVEDDFSSRILLEDMLGQYGPVHQTMNGEEAMEAFQLAIDTEKYYDLVCLDIMLPKMNGQDVLLKMRNLEKTRAATRDAHAKIIMITVISDTRNIIAAFKGQCDGYFIKPFDERKLKGILRTLHLIEA